MEKETKARSLAKTVAYRAVVVLLLAAITYAFTGNAGESTLITLVFNAAGSIVYYGMERIWDGVSWGKTG